MPKVVYSANNNGGFFINDKAMLIFITFPIPIRRIRCEILTAFSFGMKNRLDLCGQILQVVVVHQTAEMEHIGIIALAVQTVKYGHKPTSE